MRFRAKFGVVQWLIGALAGIWLVKLGLHPHRLGRIDLWMLFLILAETVQYFGTWWEIQPEGLRTRRYGFTRTIPWAQISRAARWPRASSGGVLVEYIAVRPTANRRTVHVTTGDRKAFVEQLREHAPDAEIEA